MLTCSSLSGASTLMQLCMFIYLYVQIERFSLTQINEYELMFRSKNFHIQAALRKPTKYCYKFNGIFNSAYNMEIYL